MSCFVELTFARDKAGTKLRTKMVEDAVSFFLPEKISLIEHEAQCHVVFEFGYPDEARAFAQLGKTHMEKHNVKFYRYT